MQKFPENEFDKWIKNSLEEPNIEFDPIAWQQMEQKLGIVSMPRWSVWMNNSSLVFASAIILYLLFTDVQFNIQNGSKVIAKKIADQSSIAPPQPNGNETSEDLSKSFHHLSMDKDNKTQVINSEQKDLNRKVKNNQDEQQKDQENKVFQQIKRDDSKEKQFNVAVTTDDLQRIGDQTDLKKAFVFLNAVPKSFILFETENHPKKRVILKVNKKEGVYPLVKKQKALPKFSFNVLASPDFSSVNFSNVKGTGLNYGVIIEYYLTPRWRISSGIIKSNKIYGVQEEKGYGYSTPSKTTLESIDAVCSVIDIPLNFRLNLSPADKEGLFISGGLSTYLMLQEEYDFNYKSYNTHYTDNISIEGENNHFFQIINFSIGYEKELGKHFSIQGEPFLKIPFKDVGYGKVKLFTTGVFLSVKYKLY